MRKGMLTIVTLLGVFGLALLVRPDVSGPARVGLAATPTPCAPEGLPADQVVATVTVPAGWNLVGGGDGSCMVGSVAAYFFAGSQGGYGVFPPDAPLIDTDGLFAYFPSGGRLDLTAGGSLGQRFFGGGTTQAGSPSEHYWHLVGNPSPYGPAKIIAGEPARVYDPATDSYQPTNQIPVGGAAWVLPHSSPGNILPVQIYAPTATPHP